MIVTCTSTPLAADAPGPVVGVPLCGVSGGGGWFCGWLRVVEGVVAGHDVRGRDAVVGRSMSPISWSPAPGRMREAGWAPVVEVLPRGLGQQGRRRSGPDPEHGWSGPGT